MTEIIEIMKCRFGDLLVHRGRKFDFLGMEITITKGKRVKIEMKDQLMDAVALFGSYAGTKDNEIVTSLSQKYLRLVNEDFTKVLGKKRDFFHFIIAKLFLVTKRYMPDLETSI